MRMIVFPVGIFLSVMLFGMFGYMYLLWLQYWRSVWAPTRQADTGEYQMSDFQRNEMIVDYVDEAALPPTVKLTDEKEAQSPLVYLHKNMYPGKIADVRLMMHRTKTVARLRQAMEKERNNMNDDGMVDNPYGVPSGGKTPSDKENLLCDLCARMKMVMTLNRSDIVAPIQHFLPENSLFSDSSAFNTCAIVSSAGSLYKSNLGQFIDSNDLVLRFNNAPTAGYEKDVGSKTTVRILNSQILSNPRFDFLNSNLYQNVSLLMWDPSNYTSTAQEWIENPEHNFVDSYIKFRRKYPRSNFHLLNPSVQWLLWDFIQGHTAMKIRRNPPSSGFLGIALLLPYCSIINVLEYVPTTRVTQRCHYYSRKLDPLCTYGVWHPLAAEKLIALAMNIASDENVFYDGYISIPGYNRLTC